MEFTRTLKDLVYPDNPGMPLCFIGLPHDVNFHQDVITTGLPSPPLLENLVSELLTRGLLCALLDNRKFTSEGGGEKMMKVGAIGDNLQQIHSWESIFEHIVL